MKKEVVDVWGKSMSEEIEKEEALVQGEPGAQKLTSWSSVGKKEKKRGAISMKASLHD